MSSQMVLFGQMLINNGTAIWQLWEVSVKAPFYQVQHIGLFFLILFYYCRKLHRTHQLANLFCGLFSFKSMLEVDHHPICIRTIDLQWVTGGGGCVSDTHEKKKLWSWTSCPVKKVVLLSSACDGIVVCFVICLPEEFIEKPHILSHVLSDWMSHHIDLPRYLRHFRISGSKHLQRVWIRQWKKKELMIVSAGMWCWTKMF